MWDDPSLSKKTRIDLLSNAVEDAIKKGDMGPFFKWGNALQESLVSEVKKKKNVCHLCLGRHSGPCNEKRYLCPVCKLGHFKLKKMHSNCIKKPALSIKHTPTMEGPSA